MVTLQILAILEILPPYISDLPTPPYVASNRPSLPGDPGLGRGLHDHVSGREGQDIHDRGEGLRSRGLPRLEDTPKRWTHIRAGSHQNCIREDIIIPIVYLLDVCNSDVRCHHKAGYIMFY